MKSFYTELYSIFSFLIVTIITFLSPIWGIILTVLCFILLDTRYAYVRVKKDGRAWTSKKLRVGFVNKSITYLTLIILFFMVDKFILNSIFNPAVNIEYFFTKITTLVFVYIEYTSIDESYKIIKGKSIYDNIREMLRKFNHIKNDLKNQNPDKDL